MVENKRPVNKCIFESGRLDVSKSIIMASWPWPVRDHSSKLLSFSENRVFLQICWQFVSAQKDTQVKILKKALLLFLKQPVCSSSLCLGTCCRSPIIIAIFIPHTMRQLYGYNNGTNCSSHAAVIHHSNDFPEMHLFFYFSVFVIPCCFRHCIAL